MCVPSLPSTLNLINKSDCEIMIRQDYDKKTRIQPENDTNKKKKEIKLVTEAYKDVQTKECSTVYLDLFKKLYGAPIF